MNEKKMSIEDLLLSLSEKGGMGDKFLPNTKETWRRIRSGDSFSELGFGSESEKAEFLREWTQENPYSSI